MVILLKSLFVLAGIVILILLAFRMKSDKAVMAALPDNYKEILESYVQFYRQLDEMRKREFEKRVEQFLLDVKITGVNAVVEEIDLLLIASGAIIPVFSFPDWRYINLHEVLLYPGTFNRDYDQVGESRSISGMVGTGPMQHKMILTKWQVRQGFINNNDANNTAIHEFAHLVDKMDGTFDGVPEIILERKYVKEWRQLMEKTIHHMKTHGSDINMYGATNPVEFFAVISEYFFEQPALLKTHHPDLYSMLTRIYKIEL
ncbi:MAG TPA: M90 family metallopeptidase [Chitinophagaceae bacterium]|nr:zinc-dependent peptidase [Chitinophagaceae bacterium]MCB9056895.1 zinc-dependent peptidase [Chitinophagales bacterium]HPG11459.1 M90 family metallopeptidase [Chitinophagaceae bacterium]